MEIDRILIANRGEIAVRIIKAARELGITTVAIYADLDGVDAYHCRMADLSFPLFGTDLSDTYLNIEKIISIARMAEVQAIHPGYGFLSENFLFAEACEQNDLLFIGPAARLIQLMGNKIAAREKVSQLGIAVLPGEVASSSKILQQSSSLEYPVLVKAAAGGGGKGMRIVRSEETLRDALEVTSREAETYFGNGDIYIEKYLDPARHIEFQVLGDHYGNVIHVNERECSVQRRYQKIIEESPSTWLLPETRQRMGEAAVSIARGIGYTNAGTIEFLVDEKQQFYFLEMNTRIQVEHPVTELTSGIDLVKEQILIEQGIILGYKQEEVQAFGHAIEARIYAEDPLNRFLPSPGLVAFYKEPDEPSIRMDTSLDGPARVYPEYDPMISKIIARGKDRTQAIDYLLKGLRDYTILGVETNIMFLQEILQENDYLQNQISTSYCDQRLEFLAENIGNRVAGIDPVFYISAFLAGSLLAGDLGHPSNNSQSPWQTIGYWRQINMLKFTMGEEEQHIKIGFIDRQMIRFRYHENEYVITEIKNEGGKLSFILDGEPWKVSYAPLATGEEIVEYQGLKVVFKRLDVLPQQAAILGFFDGHEHNGNKIISPMFGKIVKINVKENDTITKGDVLLVIDSMKIENNLLAPRKAKIVRIMINPGDQVELNRPLIEID